MNDWLRQRKIVRLPTARLTPETVLASTLEKAHRIKNVVVMIEWDDDTHGSDWSQMPVKSLMFHAAMLQETARVECFEGREVMSSYPPEQAE